MVACGHDAVNLTVHLKGHLAQLSFLLAGFSYMLQYSFPQIIKALERGCWGEGERDGNLDRRIYTGSVRTQDTIGVHFKCSVAKVCISCVQEKEHISVG